MWRWLNGLVSFRDTEFFYPYDTALGYSDVFLVQGIIYSIFRFFDFDSLTSWTNATVILVVIGNLGWIVIAKKYLKNYSIQILFVLNMVSSVSFVHYFTFNPNVVGYAFLSWMIVFLVNISEENNVKRFHIKINIFILSFLIYALSCWYAAFFLFLTISLRLIVIFVTSKFRFRVKSITQFYKIYLFFIPVNAFFTWLFYYVYISVSNQPGRPISEMITNSPRVQQIFRGANPNGGGMEGSLFESLYKWLNINKPIVFNEISGDWGGGLGLFVPLVGVVIIFISLVVTKTIKDYSWLVAIVAVYIYFMVFGDNISIHSYLFDTIPGLNSIRSPSRYVILVGFATIFLIFYCSDKMFFKSKNYYIKILIIAILSVIFVDQQRDSFKGWDRKDFINPDLIALKSEIQNNCDYFYYDKPGGWWFDQIEALSFAVQIGVPTVNGYSGAFPPNYPNRSWNQDSPSIEIFDWMSQIDQQKRGCLILGNSNIRYTTDSVASIDFYGFTEAESKGTSNWRWAISPEAHLFIIGKKDTRQNLEFELKGAPCFKSQDIEILFEENDGRKSFEINENGIPIKLELDFSESIGRSITIRTDSPVCNLEGDPRDLYFEIKNINLDNLA
jgi:hypothetical protein